ncbi:MAG: transcription-repair coupling factor (superfamily II helicase) [Desulfobacteraceae bacterium Eth-SRB1]|nr:MAG: transcription-repair coupling factor (superfamily II helicase) [Desulfobacteraceae bacterium Eth-SRB1]
MKLNQDKIALQQLIDIIPGRHSGIDCVGMAGSDRAYLVSRLILRHSMPIFVLVSSQKDADMFCNDLNFFINKIKQPVTYFPPYNILPFKQLAYHSETAAKRIRTLYTLTAGKTPPIVVTTVSAMLQKLIPKHELCDYAELIMAGEEIDRDLLIEKLIAGGYIRTGIVEEPGDFAVRGGILDVFSPFYSDPLRIELFGDTVDSLRFFSAISQRKIKSIKEAVILPAREAILKKNNMAQIINRVRNQASSLNIPVTKVRPLVDSIKKEGMFPGIESQLSMIYPELDTFFDYIPENALFVLIEPADLDKAAAESEEQAARNYLAACKEARLCVEPDSLYLKWTTVKEVLSKKKPLTLKMLPVSKKDPVDSQYDFSVRNNISLRKELKGCRGKENILLPLVNWINDKKESKYNTLLVCSTRSQINRLKSLLAPYDIQPGVIDGFPDKKSGKEKVYICPGRVSSGFVWPVESLAIITEDEIFGAKYRSRKISKQKVKTELFTFESLKLSDFVVHIDHGIGRYNGLVKLKLNGTTNDYLLIIYKDDDKLYLPVDRLNMVQKYMGVDGVAPVLDKMGGKSWESVKNRVKKSVEKIAGELLKLYAERKVKKGFAYKGIDSYFSDFESGFAYEETEDQLRAIDEVLNDMDKPVPMDRLVCGDVGYGKTEVALRASFLAVNNYKQVAVLVPTTVLAQQHFATFSERFEPYPVKIACLSRFRSLREQRAIIDDLKSGKIDVVIGTHRLLQKDIIFKDLGLVILDEEQRFGVKHKERLKKIRSTVDVLALTATPIPRTLHMSLMGMRDISVISTPPDHRRSIITYISELDDVVISEAIRKELERKGQIFFVHNNIHSIWAIAKKLQELVPEVRLDVAHGRLDEDDLEKVMFRFMNKEIDMLVCTTIIESGLDIPSANTILINRADRFGLAQMYQLRGRVGRADEQAYAYLFIPNESGLSRDAQKRLKVLMEHSDLGSGFQIAMSDLKLRGGGSVLGVSQSGHIAAVGYDMFLKLMEDAISRFKGEPVYESLEPEININISAFIPESFIPDIDQRFSAYRRLAKMTEIKAIADFKREMVDRFGAIPGEVVNLLLKITLRALAIKAGVKRLDLIGRQLILYFSEAHQKDPSGIVDLIVSRKRCFEFTPQHAFKAKLSKGSVGSLFVQTKNILKEIAQHVNN